MVRWARWGGHQQPREDHKYNKAAVPPQANVAGVVRERAFVSPLFSSRLHMRALIIGA